MLKVFFNANTFVLLLVSEYFEIVVLLNAAIMFCSHSVFCFVDFI